MKRIIFFCSLSVSLIQVFSMQEVSRLASRTGSDVRQSGLQSQEKAFQHNPQGFNGRSVTFYTPCKIGDEEWITDPRLAMPDAWLGQTRLFHKEDDAREWVKAQIEARHTASVQNFPRKEIGLDSEVPCSPQDEGVNRFPDPVCSQAGDHEPGRVSSYTSFSGAHKVPTSSKLNPDAKSYVPSPVKASRWPKANRNLSKGKQFPKAHKSWKMKGSRYENLGRPEEVSPNDGTKSRIDILESNQCSERSGSIGSSCEENPHGQIEPYHSYSDQSESPESKEGSVQTFSQDRRDKELELNALGTIGFDKSPMKGQSCINNSINSETKSAKKETKGPVNSAKETLQRPKIVKWSKKKPSSISPSVDLKGSVETQEDSQGESQINLTKMKEAFHEKSPDVNPSAMIDGPPAGQGSYLEDTGASSTILDMTNTLANNEDNASLVTKEMVEKSPHILTNSKQLKKKTQKTKSKLSDKKNTKPLVDEWDDIPNTTYIQAEVDLNKRLSTANILHNVLKSQNKQDFANINLSDDAFNFLIATQNTNDPSPILEDLDSYQEEFDLLIGKAESYRRFKALKSQVTQKIVTKNWKELKDRCDSTVKQIVRLLGGHIQWPVFYDIRKGETETLVKKISKLTAQQKTMLQSIIDADEQDNRVAIMYNMEKINNEDMPKVFTERKLQLFQKQGVPIASILKIENLLHLTSPYGVKFMLMESLAAKILDFIDLMNGQMNTISGETLIMDQIDWINSTVRKCFVEENESLKKILENGLWSLAAHGRILEIPYDGLDPVGARGAEDLKDEIISLDRALIVTHFGISFHELVESQTSQPEEIGEIFKGTENICFSTSTSDCPLEGTILKLPSEALRKKWIELYSFVKRSKDNGTLTIRVQ